jgi:hypothetical protein
MDIIFIFFILAWISGVIPPPVANIKLDLSIGFTRLDGW